MICTDVKCSCCFDIEDSYEYEAVQIYLNDNQTQSAYIEKIRNNNKCVTTKRLFEFQNSDRDRRNQLGKCLSIIPIPNKTNNSACFS